MDINLYATVTPTNWIEHSLNDKSRTDSQLADRHEELIKLRNTHHHHHLYCTVVVMVEVVVVVVAGL